MATPKKVRSTEEYDGDTPKTRIDEIVADYEANSLVDKVTASKNDAGDWVITVNYI